MIVAAVAALLSLGWAAVVGAVFAAWAVVALFEILMAASDGRRAVSAEAARGAEPPPDHGAPDAPADAMVAEPGEAPPPTGPATDDAVAAETVRVPDAAAEPADAPGDAAAPASASPAPDEHEPPPPLAQPSVPVARGPFEPAVGAPDPHPLALPSPLAVPPRADDAPEQRR